MFRKTDKKEIPKATHGAMVDSVCAPILCLGFLCWLGSQHKRKPEKQRTESPEVTKKPSL